MVGNSGLRAPVKAGERKAGTFNCVNGIPQKQRLFALKKEGCRNSDSVTYSLLHREAGKKTTHPLQGWPFSKTGFEKTV